MESQNILLGFVGVMHGTVQILRKQSVLKAYYRYEASSSHRATSTHANRQWNPTEVSEIVTGINLDEL